MRVQREKPGISAAAVKSMTGASTLPTRLSGGQIENFKSGWALNIMGSGHIAHYFEREGFDKARSLCNMQVQVRWLYGRGNFQCCQRCATLTRRAGSLAHAA